MEKNKPIPHKIIRDECGNEFDLDSPQTWLFILATIAKDERIIPMNLILHEVYTN